MTPGAVWNCQKGVGSSGNGGCFDAANKGATGVDYSMQAAAQATGTVTSATTTVTATGAIFDNTMLGNCITDGTTFVIITGFTSSTIVTVDTAPSWTAASIKVGGCMDSIGNVYNKVVAGNTVNIKYTGTNDTITNFGLQFTSGTVTAPIKINGYQTTPGDIVNGTPAATHTANGFLGGMNYPSITMGGSGFSMLPFIVFQGIFFTSTINGAMFNNSGGAPGRAFFRCKFSNTSTGSSASTIDFNVSVVINDCDISCVGVSGGFAVGAFGGWLTLITNNRITGTNCSGLLITSGSVKGNVFYSMALSQVAVAVLSVNASICLENNTFDSILGTCFSTPASTQTSPFSFFSNNKISNCGTGCNNLQSGTQRLLLFGGNNQFWNTTTPYTGWSNVADTTGLLPGDILANPNYVNRTSTPPNLRPSSADGGIGMGLPLGQTIGAFQFVKLPSQNYILQPLI